VFLNKCSKRLSDQLCSKIFKFVENKIFIIKFKIFLEQKISLEGSSDLMCFLTNELLSVPRVMGQIPVRANLTEISKYKKDLAKILIKETL